ncbi:MAG: tetratricopeptide repeat protein [Planctomycetota bacterium]|jgi:tetratricopeptide (TPR) repeat protein
MIKCSNCNTEITNDRWTMCPECGTEIKIQKAEETEPVHRELSVEEFENAEVKEVLSEEKTQQIKKSMRVIQGLVTFAIIASIAGSMITNHIRTKNRKKRQTKQFHNNYSQKSLPELNNIIKENQFNADALYARGNKLLAAARFEEAIIDYEKSIKISPYYINNYYGIGQAKRRLKDLAGSLQAFDKLLARRPKYWQAWFERGVTCQMMKNESEVDRCTAIIEKITKKKGYKAEIVKRAKWEESYIKQLSVNRKQ